MQKADADERIRHLQGLHQTAMLLVRHYLQEQRGQAFLYEMPQTITRNA
jgi:hypothetical protein